MQTSITTEEQTILRLLKEDDEHAMERIFDTYYAYLVNAAYHMLRDEHQAKDLVQDVLFNFWSKREEISIETGLKAYLKRATVNKSIDQIRRKKRFGVPEEITDFNQASLDASVQEVMETSDLEATILAAIKTLPERCQLVFSLSRFEDLSHKEIDEKLDISTKTIENQMTKALKTIRLAVKQYKELCIAFLWFLN